MRVGINLLYLIPGAVGGTETYAVSLLDSLAAIDTENEYFVYLNEEARELVLPDSPNFHKIVCPVRGARRPCRYAWEQVVLPSQLRRHHINLVHSLGYVTSLATPCPNIVTIPDLNFVALKDFLPASKRLLLRFFSTQSAHRSTHILTISEFSKNEITRVLGVSPTKVTVTHLGPGWGQTSQIAWSAIQEYHDLPQPYIVAFGGGAGHKNISRLLSAFGRVCRDHPHALVLIGRLAPNLVLKMGLAESVRNRVVALGYIPVNHIAPILGHADLFVLPSLYEGFGLPVLEAQLAGVAVACSNAASLPEIAGDGAVFFDPYSVDNMAFVIRQCLSENGLRSQLRELGERNVQRFSWLRTAEETLAIYRQVCGPCVS